MPAFTYQCSPSLARAAVEEQRVVVVLEAIGGVHEETRREVLDVAAGLEVLGRPWRSDTDGPVVVLVCHSRVADAERES